MVAKLKLFMAAAVLSGLFVAPVGNGAAAAVPAESVECAAPDTQRFKDLIDSATWDMAALVAWLETLRECHADPAVIGEISLDLASLVKDDNPNRDTILALIQDMLATAAGPVDPLALTDQDTRQFEDLIDPKTWDMAALVAWLETLLKNHPDPGIIGEITLDLALLVEDDNPNQDIIFALLQDMLPTAAGPVVVVSPSALNLAENPCQIIRSPIC